MLRLCSIILMVCISYLGIGQSRSCIDKTAVSSSGLGESGVRDISAKWTNGATLTVKFLAGSSYMHDRIKEVARTWERYANIKFQYTTYGSADIRIAFNRGGYWSYCGTNAKSISQDQQTMNFEGFNDYTPDNELRRTVLHEFGHALGLLHEHKSPLSRIQWNKQRVYAHYLQTQGWSPEQVDHQVINRYSVTMSNNEYDPHSIMHYPIDPSLTIDGYSVGWNTELSSGDKKLIGEMYPFSTTRPLSPETPVISGGAVVCQLNNISIDHNIISGGKNGMKIKGSFIIQNALGRNCKFVAYFYYGNGEPLKDFNSLYYSQNGSVSVGKDLVPVYSNEKFTDEELYIPYDELHMGIGKHNLKVMVSVFDDQLKIIAQGGTTYFTYRNGPIFSPVLNIQSFDNVQGKLIIMPKFSVENASRNTFQMYTYLYYQNGTPVTIYNPATARYEPVTFSNNFTPGYDNTTYNYGYYSDLFINVPYSSFPIFNRRTDYKYFTAIFKNGQQVATSSWTEFYLNR